MSLNQQTTAPAGDKYAEAEVVLECNGLCISYFTRAGEIPAVIDFNM